jgi:hypothetical protein
MTTAYWCTCNDCESNTQGKSKSYLEYISKEHYRKCSISVDRERSHRSDSRKNVEEDSSSLGHALPKTEQLADILGKVEVFSCLHSGALVLKVQLPLANRLWMDNMTADMVLEHVCNS